MCFRLRTPLDDECEYENMNTLVFEFLRDVNTAKTSIIVLYVEVFEVMKGTALDIIFFSIGKVENFLFSHFQYNEAIHQSLSNQSQEWCCSKS